jgi:hypothetical protein
MRDADSVDHSQKRVAKPTARPPGSRPMSWSPSCARSAMSVRESASSSSSGGATA